MNLAKTIKKLLLIMLLVFSTGAATYAMLTECAKNENIISKEACKLVFTEGKLKEPQEKYTKKANTPYNTIIYISSDSDASDSDNAESHAGERTYEIIESKYTAAGTSYDNFYVKNISSANINISELLNARLSYSAANDYSPQVLIVHTHTSESYMDTDAGFYYESYSARSNDDKKNVTAVGKAIADELTLCGIGAIHDATHHDAPGYNGSYERSMETIQQYLQKYPSICVVLDIHRDALVANDDAIIKPTFTVNGKKAAQIMIMCGCDTEGVNDFSFWQENLKLALKLQSKAETLYPGMTRPLYFGDFTYNMNANSGSLLIEIGTHANTLDEAKYTGKLLGNVLAQVLKEG